MKNLRVITFVPKSIAEPNPPARLYWMTDPQSEFVGELLEKSAAVPDIDDRQWRQVQCNVERLVLAYLQGFEPAAHLAKILRYGRTLFPVLSDADVRALPRHGAPEGWINALLVSFEACASDGSVEDRLVRYDLSPLQQQAFNEALEKAPQWELPASAAGLSVRDVAWRVLTGTVAICLRGGIPGLGLDAMRAVFPTTPLLELPEATDEDVRDYGFTRAPL